MKFLIPPIIILLMGSVCPGQNGFRESQQEKARVRQAYMEKWDSLASLLEQHRIRRETVELYLVAYKQEKEFEVWARNHGEERFILLRSYKICATSGTVGPKRREGDLQIPEGFYRITAFNPWSSFLLSMCIDYPNASDRVLSDKEHPGGNICIHGSCVTIGCIPLTDDVIREVYLLCVEARSNGQERIPVTIYPAKLNPLNYRALALVHRNDTGCLKLWSELKIAHDLFQETRELPRITFLEDGRHHIQ